MKKLLEHANCGMQAIHFIFKLKRKNRKKEMIQPNPNVADISPHCLLVENQNIQGAWGAKPKA